MLCYRKTNFDMSKFIQYLAARLRWIKLTNWRNHLKNYQCVIQFFCSIPASLVTKYDFQFIETWSSTQKLVNKCKFKKIYHCTLQADILFLYDQWFFSGWTPRNEERKISASNLLLFQWASKPTLNAIIYFFLFCSSIRFNNATATRM